MAKKWYPVIDYLTCAECGACIKKCPHGVYEAEKAPTPVVTNPDGCVDHCHGCGNLCPQGAITYVGEDTGWVPPNGKEQESEDCCSCGCDADSDKKVFVEYLYLDLQTCDRCLGTEKVLDEVLSTLSPVLNLAGYEMEYKKIEIATAELAEKYQFLSSPTIRVNGRDVCDSVAENSCACCSDISGTDVDCRVFEYKGETYEVAPKEMLADATLHAVFGDANSGCFCGRYKLPENLKNFFAGKATKSGCSCGGNCC